MSEKFKVLVTSPLFRGGSLREVGSELDVDENSFNPKVMERIGGAKAPKVTEAAAKPAAAPAPAAPAAETPAADKPAKKQTKAKAPKEPKPAAEKPAAEKPAGKTQPEPKAKGKAAGKGAKS